MNYFSKGYFMCTELVISNTKKVLIINPADGLVVAIPSVSVRTASRMHEFAYNQ